MLTIAGWVLASVGLSFYFAYFAGYTAYGALGAVMTFIFWLYVMGLTFLLGGELNSVLGRMAGTVAPESPAGYSERGVAAGSAPASGRAAGRAAGLGARSSLGVTHGGSAPRSEPKPAPSAKRGGAGATWRRLARLAVVGVLTVVGRFGLRPKSRAVARTLTTSLLADAAPPPTRSTTAGASAGERGHVH